MTIRTANSDYVCGWSFSDDCCSKLATAFDTKPDLAQACVDQAGEILYALSGRQFGICEVTVRPCMEKCMDSELATWSAGTLYPWVPYNEGGKWFNLPCGGRCRDACSCTQICKVRLPGPVDSITEVLLDGVVVPPTDYRVDYKRELVRTSDGCWPTCQDMNLESTEVGTWEVTYAKGQALPVAGEVALGAFACELAKACLNDTTCALPARVTNIVRQGITMTLLDPMAFIDEGKTGIYMVDAWLHAINPQGRSRHAGVYSPDVHPFRTT